MNTYRNLLSELSCLLMDPSTYLKIYLILIRKKLKVVTVMTNEYVTIWQVGSTWSIQEKMIVKLSIACYLCGFLRSTLHLIC